MHAAQIQHACDALDEHVSIHALVCGSTVASVTISNAWPDRGITNPLHGPYPQAAYGLGPILPTTVPINKKPAAHRTMLLPGGRGHQAHGTTCTNATVTATVFAAQTCTCSYMCIPAGQKKKKESRQKVLLKLSARSPPSKAKQSTSIQLLRTRHDRAALWHGTRSAHRVGQQSTICMLMPSGQYLLEAQGRALLLFCS